MREWTKYILAILVLFALVVWAQDGSGPGVSIEFMSKEIIGTVVFQDGETPVDGLPVRIWSVDRKKMIYRTRTDNDGIFSVPKIQEGNCYIFVGQLKIDMRILQRSGNMLIQNHDLVIVLPRPFIVQQITPSLAEIVLNPFTAESLLAPTLFDIPTQPPVPTDVIIFPEIEEPPEEPKVVSP